MINKALNLDAACEVQVEDETNNEITSIPQSIAIEKGLTLRCRQCR